MVRITLSSSLYQLAESSWFRRVLFLMARFAVRDFFNNLSYCISVVCSVHAVAVNGIYDFALLWNRWLGFSVENGTQSGLFLWPIGDFCCEKQMLGLLGWAMLSLSR